MYITRKETKSSDREQEADEDEDTGIISAPVDALPLAYFVIEASKSEPVVEAVQWILRTLLSGLM